MKEGEKKGMDEGKVGGWKGEMKEEIKFSYMS